MAYRHHHRNAKRLAEASRRCDHPPKRSVLRELQSLSRCNTRVTADLVDPCGVWSTASTSPVLRWPLTVGRLDTDSKWRINSQNSTLVKVEVTG